MTGKIVDAHQHVNWQERNAGWLIEDMDKQGIAYCWLLTWLIEPDDPLALNGNFNPANVRLDGTHEGATLRDIIEAKEKHPNRFVVGYAPDPKWRQAPVYLRKAYHMHGARVCGEWKGRMLFDDPRCLEVFHVAGELKMPVVLHLDAAYLNDAEGRRHYQAHWYGNTTENLERALQACPETVFIGHAPGFWREISADADKDAAVYPDGKVIMRGKLYRLFDTYPNLYADLSAGSGLRALKRDPAHARDFITRYADRLLFGRDRYGTLLHDFLQTLPLETEALDKIYSQNAERLVSAP